MVESALCGVRFVIRYFTECGIRTFIRTVNHLPSKIITVIFSLAEKFAQGLLITVIIGFQEPLGSAVPVGSTSSAADLSAAEERF